MKNASMGSANSGAHHAHHMNDPVQKLIDSTQYTHIAVKSGAWSDPKTWNNGFVPTDKAKVLIEKGSVVTYDQISDARIETVAVEGDLKFATNQDTQLKVKTILNAATGQLDVGTAGRSVSADKRARIIFTSDSALDSKWDPSQLSKGLVSRGVVNIYGADKADQLALVGDVTKGSSVLKFKDAPVGWKVGDRIVLGGTRYDSRGKHSDNSKFQDEVLTVTSIQGKEVRFVNEDIKSGNRNVLRFDHVRSNIANSADKLTLYAGNITRNVTFETENGKNAPINRRAHVMLMHNPNVSVVNAGFYDLGRSDKSKLVDDPGKNVDGSKGNGTNPRGRYSLHLHRTGTDDIKGKAATVRGNAVEGSPGWGIVQHDSFANLSDNVVFDVVGAGIAAESGNEIGSWTNNLTIKSTGIPLTDFNRQREARDRRFDFGVEGDGFWTQGAALIENKNNKAISSNSAGLTLFGSALNSKHFRDVTTLEVSKLPPELKKLFPADQKEVDIRDVPMATVEGFESYNAAVGLRVWAHNTNFDGELAFNTKEPETAHQGRSLIKDFKLWSNRFRGASVQYSSNVDLKDGIVLGNDIGIRKAVGAGILVNQESYGSVFDNLTVAGFELGADIAPPNTEKEYIAPALSNSSFSENTYNLGEAGVPSGQGGLNDFAAYLKLKNNKFDSKTGNQAPTAKFETKAVGGLAFDFDAGTSQDADPLRGGNPNVAKLDSKGIAGYAWDLDGNGSVDRFGREITHVFDKAGPQNVSLTVWDSQGKTTSVKQTLNVQPASYVNAFTNGDFSSTKLQIPGNDNSQWADQGWFASKGVKVTGGAGKISVPGDSTNYIGQVVNNEKVHRGQQTLSFDLKNVDAGKRSFDANNVTVSFWGVNGQFDNISHQTAGPYQVGTLPMQRTQLASLNFNQQNGGLFDWKTISTDVNLGKGYDYLLFQVNAEKIKDAKDFVAIDNLSLAGKGNTSGGTSVPPIDVSSPAPNDPSPTVPSPTDSPPKPAPNPSSPTNAPTFPSELAPVARLSFDEGSGQMAADTSTVGKNNNGQLKNTRWNKGKFGQAADLNGRNSFVSINNSKDINLGTHPERTVSMWFKAGEASGEKKQVIYEEGGRTRGVNIYLENDTLFAGGWSNGKWAEGNWIATDEIQDDKWHHVALVVDGEKTLQPDTLTAYLDGEKLGTEQGTQLLSHGDRIGLGNTNGSTRFADGTFGRQNKNGLLGGVDELQIFNDALSSAQVQQLASGAFV